jgi:hypothetical protein
MCERGDHTTMALLESLPSRPLTREEVDSLDDADSIHGAFPVYGERNRLRDTAYALILVIDGVAHALAWGDDGWTVVTRREIDADEHGVSFDEHETIRELQKEAARYTDAVDV